MNGLDYVSHLRFDGELMARAAASDMQAHVPSCPEWNVTQLVTHTGRHHRWVANAVRGGGEVPADTQEPGLHGPPLLDWFRRGWEELATLLEGLDDDAPAWSWAGDNRVGFWRRRTALETLVHRWDAENATGEASSLDPELAADGVDEMLFVFFPDTETPYDGEPGRLGFQTIDVPRTWLVELRSGVIPAASRSRMEDGPPDADAVVAGPSEEMLLFLWGRYGPERVMVSGNEAVFDSFRSWSA